MGIVPSEWSVGAGGGGASLVKGASHNAHTTARSSCSTPHSEHHCTQALPVPTPSLRVYSTRDLRPCTRRARASLRPPDARVAPSIELAAEGPAASVVARFIDANVVRRPWSGRVAEWASRAGTGPAAIGAAGCLSALRRLLRVPRANLHTLGAHVGALSRLQVPRGSSAHDLGAPPRTRSRRRRAGRGRMRRRGGSNRPRPGHRGDPRRSRAGRSRRLGAKSIPPSGRRDAMATSVGAPDRHRDHRVSPPGTYPPPGEW